MRRLTDLVCADDPVVDLGPLAASPSLAVLNIAGTTVVQLAPLQGCAALRNLNCGRNKALVDLRPLAGVRGLQHLNCGGTSVADLRPLQGLSLVGLNCRDTPATDLTPICNTGLKSLDCANLAIDQKAFLGLRLTSLTCSGTRVTELDFVAPMPLESLDCSRTAVANLRPLAGKGITSLNCADCRQIADLTPLADGPLVSLNCGNTGVESFYPLRRLKALTSLACVGCPAADWESLKDVPLKELTIDPKRPDLDALKRLRSLERINGQLRADFFRTAGKPAP
jgi:Leucine-rich repeat (LRR) protein